MVSLGLRCGSICQGTALARKILWHTGWVRSLPSTERYEVCNEEMKPVRAFLPPFYCCYEGASLHCGPYPSLFNLDLWTHFPFLSSADLADKLGFSCWKFLFASISSSPAPPKCVCKIPHLVASVPNLWPDVFISLLCSGCCLGLDLSGRSLGRCQQWQWGRRMEDLSQILLQESTVKVIWGPHSSLDIWHTCP